MYCYNCGKEIADSAVACVYCGKPVITEKPAEEKVKKQSPVLWILSMVYAFISPFIGLILGLVGSFVYKDEINKKRSVSAMIVNGSAVLTQAVVSAYGFAITMQILKPFIDTVVATIGK